MVEEKTDNKNVSVSENESLLGLNDVIDLNQIAKKIREPLIKFIQTLRDYKKGDTFSNDTEIIKKTLGEDNFEALIKKDSKKNMKISLFSKLADEIEKLTDFYTLETLDVFCTIDILNQITKNTIIRREDLGYYYRLNNKDKIFYKMNNIDFGKRITYLKNLGILDKQKKKVSAHNKLDTKLTEEKNVFVIKEDIIKIIYGIDLDYLNKLCEVVFIPLGKKYAKLKMKYDYITNKSKWEEEAQKFVIFMSNKIFDFIYSRIIPDFAH